MGFQPACEGLQGGVGLVLRRRFGILLHQPPQIERPARLGPGARQAAPAKGLHADHRADDIAVDVEVPRLHPPADMGDGGIEPRVQPEGQPVAGGVDRIDQRIEPVTAIADDMQHRAKNLTPQIGDGIQFDDGRRDEAAMGGAFRQIEPLHPVALGLHRGDMGFDACLGLLGDDRADVHRQPLGAADAQFAQGAAQHLQRAVGDLLLQAQDAQRRAALPRAVEGRGDDIAHHLLGQRRAVDDHRVLAAGLGDQRDRGAIRRQALGQLLLDQPRHLGRAGEHHARDLLGPDQRRADGAIAADQLQRVLGHARLMQQRTLSAATSGVSSAGLASTGLPATSAAASCPVKIASGKFHGLMQTTGPSGA
jgi:hypothetical protein